MAVTAFKSGIRYTVAEPIATAWKLLPQFLITTASVFMVAQFGMAHNILPWWVAVPMAVGFEWTWLRGIATASKVDRGGEAEYWITLLTKTAMITVVAYGILYIIGLPAFGVIPEKPGAVWGVVLAIAKVVPIALMGYAAANLHRIYEQQEKGKRDARAEMERQREQSLQAAEDARQRELQAAQDQIAIDALRKEKDLELWRKGIELKRELRAIPVAPVASKKKPVTIDGVTYESRAAAAKALGISPQAVSKRAKP